MQNDNVPRNHGDIAIKRPLQCVLAGLRFLTILPIPPIRDEDGAYLAGSLFYFSVIGLFIGLVTAGAALLYAYFTPSLLSAALSIITLSLLSGFLHMDGLADSADGFMSSRPSDKCLEIMKDSRTGVMGCVAVCSVLLVKTAALASIPGQLSVAGLVIAATAGRAAIVCSMAVLPYVRPGGGLATLFFGGSEKTAALVSLVWLFVISLVFARSQVVAISVAFLFVLVIFSAICKRRIGGVTGDTLGAVCELTETSVLISFTI